MKPSDCEDNFFNQMVWGSIPQKENREDYDSDDSSPIVKSDCSLHSSLSGSLDDSRVSSESICDSEVGVLKDFMYG